MQYTTTSTKLKDIKTDCLILGIYEGKQLTSASAIIDKASRGEIKAILKHGDIHGDQGETFVAHNIKGIQAKRILLVGCGKKDKLTALEYKKIIANCFLRLKRTKSKNAVTTLQQVAVKEQTEAWAIKTNVIELSHKLYQLTKFKSTKISKPDITKLSFAFDTQKEIKAANQIVKEAKATAEGMAYTKDLGNTPPNICNPTYLANEAKKMAKKYKNITCEVLEEKDMKKLGMGSFLSVTQGSDTPGKMISIKYKGGKAGQAPIVFVGKGVTFDTGGNCIKTAMGMSDMKFDMCGAATVFGIIQACADMGLKLNVTGVVAAAENMINGKASRTSDIVTSMSGQTIEITNTDAEGRLVLCDAMTYSEKYKPREVITVATLTGAAIISLGYFKSGLMTNHQALANNILAAGIEAEDRAWQLPLNDEYQALLRSEFADMVNAVVSREAGTVTSGCFLSNYAKKFKWAHLDIAGTSVIPGRQAKASGRPIPLLMQYLINQAG